jgi:hypothetical protein
MSTIGQRLNDLRGRSGLSLEDVAFKANYRGRSSVQKFFSPTYDPPALDRIVAARLARALVGHGSPPVEEAELLALAGDNVAALPNYKFKEINGLRRDVAVYGCMYVTTRPILKNQVSLAVYTMQTADPMTYYWHPPGLMDSPDIYGVQVLKRALTPRFRPGEVVFADGIRPAKLGDDVLIQLGDLAEQLEDETFNDSTLVLFGTYESLIGDLMQFRTFDQSETFKVHIDSAAALHPLVTLDEALRG